MAQGNENGKHTAPDWSEVAAKAAEDDRAFERLYREFFPRVYNFIFARLKDAASADEAAADVFWNVYRRLPMFDKNRASFSTWIFSIASNVATDYARRRGRLQETAWEEFFDPAAPEELSPEAKILTEEGNRECLEAVGALLSENERNIIALRYWADLSNKEIAEVMGLTANHVGVVLHRALATLRKKMEKP